MSVSTTIKRVAAKLALSFAVGFMAGIGFSAAIFSVTEIAKLGTK